MLRRHLGTIVYLTLIIVAAGLYGLVATFVGVPQNLPFWAVFCIFLAVGVVISILGDVISRALVRWDTERQAVKAYEKENNR
jgi:predicted RND superfamily exporter protein